MFFELFSNGLCVVVGPIVLLGEVTVMSLSVHVKYLQHKCKDTKYSSKTLHCKRMINVIYFTCRGDEGCGGRVYYI